MPIGMDLGRVVALLQSRKVAAPNTIQHPTDPLRRSRPRLPPFPGLLTPGGAFGHHPLLIGELPGDGSEDMSHTILVLFGYLFQWLGGSLQVAPCGVPSGLVCMGGSIVVER